jgi:hypothetical protein
VRAFGRRAKKLIVAFHFQFANQAGWRCDDCRRNGLELKRRCRWAPAAAATPKRVVWARNQTAVTTCPKSYITAQSTAWLEEFYVWRRLGGIRPDRLTARQAEAYLLIEDELGREAQ